MDRKSFQPTDLQLSETGEVVVAFSRLNVIDHDGDVTFPGALPVGKAVPISDFNHSSWDVSMPVGKGVIGETADLGILTGGFFMETDQGRNAYHTVKAMADLQEWSYGYLVTDGGPVTFDGRKANAIRKADVFEVSPVLLGAGIQTSTLAIKSGVPGPDAPYAEHAAWVREAVEAFLKRTDDRAEWRAKEGRVLSAANRATLSSLLDTLRSFAGTADDLEAFLAATDPQKASRDVTLDVLLGIARMHGVTV